MQRKTRNPVRVQASNGKSKVGRDSRHDMGSRATLNHVVDDSGNNNKTVLIIIRLFLGLL